MYKIYDLNYLYEAANKAMRSSKFKYGTQRFREHQLIEVTKLQEELMKGTYKPQPGIKFKINERGHERYITSDRMRDKAVTHLLCDEYVQPAIEPYLIYDNDASQKNKGVSHYRKRFETHLKKYVRKYGTEGYVLFMDFSGFYPNLHHDVCIKMLEGFLIRKFKRTEETEVVMKIIRLIFKKFEQDVSRFTDEEIEKMYLEKVSPTMNMDVNPKMLTGQKMLRKGVDIGNQLSQSVGIMVPYVIDNYIKIVCGCKYYGRYTDDMRLIHYSKEYLRKVLTDVEKISESLGLLINKKKTKIIRLDKCLTHLQIKHYVTSTGKIYKRIKSKTLKRERDRLKAYKRLMDTGKMPYKSIENAFKSWLGTQWKYMSRRQISNISLLYKNLYGGLPTWKTGHSRLHWLMVHSSVTL